MKRLSEKLKQPETHVQEAARGTRQEPCSPALGRLAGARAGSVHREALSTNRRGCKRKRCWASPGCPVHAEWQPGCKKLPL